MNPATHVDRRATQTQEQYAADDLEVMQEAPRYGAHLFNLFRPYLGTRIFEVGSGIGTMSSRLAEVAEFVYGIEPNQNCVIRARQAMAGNPRFELHERLLEECDPRELAALRFDTVFCSNVLEHIEDDVAALRRFHDALVPGGHVCIFVPAVQAAYGPLDAELGHFRRYSKRGLSQVFERAGLELPMIRYTNPIGLAGWMYNARIRKTTHHSAAQVRLFDRLIAPWALPLERVLPLPIGLSLAAVGRKRKRT